MFRFLASLLAVVERVLAYFDQQHWKRLGRQETIKEMNDELNRQIELGEAAISTPDPERDERLRNRFDRSRSG
jgi:hypothetical protein